MEFLTYGENYKRIYPKKQIFLLQKNYNVVKIIIQAEFELEFS